MARKTGARGLKSILELAMRDIMFELPSREDVRYCLITKDVIRGTAQPVLDENLIPLSEANDKASA